MDTPKFPHHRDCEALTGITLDHLPRDGSLGRVRRFAKGAFLWRPDGAADRIYFLRKGGSWFLPPSLTSGRLPCARSSRTSRSANSVSVAFGEGFGERRPAAVVASETFEIKLIQFLNYLRQNRPVIEAMMFTLCLRLTDAEHRIEVMAHRGAEQRLGRLLLRLASSPGRKGSLGMRDTVAVSVSQNELAQLAGMSRPHVTVTMGRLRNRRLVQYERESLVRVDVTGLTEYLGRIVRGERA